MKNSKEEPKQETQGYICPQTKKQCDDECCVSAEHCHIEASFDIISECEQPKQETLEEFALEQSLKIYGDYDTEGIQSNARAFIKIGAKWQAERMYSEEEVVSFIHKFIKEHQPQLPYLIGGINMWFKQFKKNNKNVRK